jgi:hypothetical protein
MKNYEFDEEFDLTNFKFDCYQYENWRCGDDRQNF